MARIYSSIELSIGQSSIAGKKAVNEDCAGIHIPNGETLLMKGIAAVIADGVSAASFGKEAAEMCVSGFINDYFSTPDSWSVKHSGQRVIDSLNRWLFAQSHFLSLSEEKGYVSTMSAMVFHSRTATIFHVGDTRIYRLRAGQLEILTCDHQSQIATDVSYLNRAMGLDLNTRVDFRELEIEIGDVFLLASDGLYRWLNDENIIGVIDSIDLEIAANRLIDIALKNGSDDNLTAQLIRVNSLPEATQDEIFQLISKRPFPPVLYPGQKIDDLEVLEVVYESNRSQLYKVKDKQSDGYYIMKTPSINFVDDAAYIERFINEEWIGRRINNPHLVRVVEREKKPRFLYYLMEEAEGVTLAEWIIQRKDTLEVLEIVDLIRQIVSGVRCLHRKQVLHQDLKLDNIMVTENGLVKIIDYGSCSVASIKKLEVAYERQQQLGTLEFGAPEYRLANHGTWKSDLFSIAMIAYYILSKGGKPYGKAWISARTLEDFAKLKYCSMSKFSKAIPGWIDEALEKALKINPDERYESLSEFLYDLERPNNNFRQKAHLSLYQRDKMTFWKLASAVLFTVVIVLLFVLFLK